MDNFAQHILHPDDIGMEQEGQELQDIDDSDEEPQSTRPQTESEAQDKWAALLNDDWRETAALALVPAGPGDDPTAVAEAEDASPRFRSPPPPASLAPVLLFVGGGGGAGCDPKTDNLRQDRCGGPLRGPRPCPMAGLELQTQPAKDFTTGFGPWRQGERNSAESLAEAREGATRQTTQRTRLCPFPPTTQGTAKSSKGCQKARCPCVGGPETRNSGRPRGHSLRLYPNYLPERRVRQEPAANSQSVSTAASILLSRIAVGVEGAIS